MSDDVSEANEAAFKENEEFDKEIEEAPVRRAARENAPSQGGGGVELRTSLSHAVEEKYDLRAASANAEGETDVLATLAGWKKKVENFAAVEWTTDTGKALLDEVFPEATGLFDVALLVLGKDDQNSVGQQFAVETREHFWEASKQVPLSSEALVVRGVEEGTTLLDAGNDKLTDTQRAEFKDALQYSASEVATAIAIKHHMGNDGSPGDPGDALIKSFNTLAGDEKAFDPVLQQMIADEIGKQTIGKFLNEHDIDENGIIKDLHVIHKRDGEILPEITQVDITDKAQLANLVDALLGDVYDINIPAREQERATDKSFSEQDRPVDRASSHEYDVDKAKSTPVIDEYDTDKVKSTPVIDEYDTDKVKSTPVIEYDVDKVSPQKENIAQLFEESGISEEQFKKIAGLDKTQEFSDDKEQIVSTNEDGTKKETPVKEFLGDEKFDDMTKQLENSAAINSFVDKVSLPDVDIVSSRASQEESGRGGWGKS